MLRPKYDYEPLCFEVETGGRTVKYKPDFFINQLDLFFEIKPNKPYDIENTKAAAWSKHIGDTVILFNLNPPTNELENGWMLSCEEIDKVPMLSESYNWCECPKCGHINIAECGQSTFCGCFTLDDFNRIYELEALNERAITPNFEQSDRLLAAYKKAKSYKFSNSKNEKVPKLDIQLDLF